MIEIVSALQTVLAWGVALAILGLVFLVAEAGGFRRRVWVEKDEKDGAYYLALQDPPPPPALPPTNNYTIHLHYHPPASPLSAPAYRALEREILDAQVVEDD